MPSSIKDISYSIKDYSKTQELQDLLLNYQSDIVKNIYIFDYFKNEKQEEIKIGFRFTFQSKKATLNSAEIELVYNDIVNKSLKHKWNFNSRNVNRHMNFSKADIVKNISKKSLVSAGDARTYWSHFYP